MDGPAKCLEKGNYEQQYYRMRIRKLDCFYRCKNSTISFDAEKVGQPAAIPKMQFQKPFVGAIDNGTSSTRFIVFDVNGNIVTQSQREYPQIYPQAGWAEHNPTDIYEFTRTCIENVAKQLKTMDFSPKDVASIGITNQRETTCVWSRATGKPIHNALVWLDVRTKELVHELIAKTPTQKANEFVNICGLPISTYFSAVKLKWLIDNVPAVKEAHDSGDLMFGTVDSWLLYKFSGGVDGGVHVTDVTNASRTMLMNLRTLRWDSSMLKFFGINESSLPAIKSSSEVYAVMKDGSFAEIPLAGILGDQQAALVGQKCFKAGMLKNTYGTGCFMLANTGHEPVISSHGLLTTVGYQFGSNTPCVYALEGSIAIAGASVKWLRDNLGIIKSAAEVGKYADEVTDTGGAYFVPAFSGLFAPHWRDDARGAIVGLTQYTSRSHICRATLEAVSYQTKDIMDSMEKDSGQPITCLRVDGGMALSDQLMQIQADIAGADIIRPKMLESTALGAAYAAGLATGVWSSTDAIKAVDDSIKFSPNITLEKRMKMRAGWSKALEKSLNWEE